MAQSDVDGEGHEEMIVTAPGLDSGGADLGRVYVFGDAPELQAGEDADGALTGSASGEQLGTATTSDH